MNDSATFIIKKIQQFLHTYSNTHYCMYTILFITDKVFEILTKIHFRFEKKRKSRGKELKMEGITERIINNNGTSTRY